MNLDLSRFKNYGLWVSIFALLPIILSAFGVKIVPEEYQLAVNAVLGVLVALGIVSNPTTEGKWYSDDKNTIESPVDEKLIDNSEEPKA